MEIKYKEVLDGRNLWRITSVEGVQIARIIKSTVPTAEDLVLNLVHPEDEHNYPNDH